MPTKKLVAVFLLWLAFVIWNGWGLVTAIQDHAALGARDPYSAAPTVSAMILNFWALASALFLALNAMNPFGAYNGKRLAFGCMAVAIMTGRLFISPLLTIGALTIPPFWLFLVAPFGLMVSGIVADILLLFVVGTVFVIFTIVPTLLLAQIGMFEKSFKVYRQESEGLGGYIGRGLRWLANEPEPDTPPDDTKGARFATDKEITALTASPADASFARSMAFGHRHGPLTLLNEKHVLIMASTRSGKGVTLIIPHLLRYQGSAFVLDPKGENAKATSRRRAQLNDQVHVLDPFGITGLPKARFNPLSRFTLENMEAESKALAAAMFVVGERERDHWTAAGQQLLSAIIMFVYLSPDIPRDKRDLPQVRKVLLGSVRPALKSGRKAHPYENVR